MNRIVVFFVALAFLVSCSKKPIQISTAENATSLDTKGLIYSLPRTVLKVKVDAIKTVIVPGPYAKYAQKYLGISDVPTRKVEEWKLSNIDIQSSVESDPTALYAISLGDKVNVNFLKLSSSGLIIPVSGFGVTSLSVKNIQENETANQLVFTDLSTSPFIASEKTTFYSKVQRDSTFVKVPIQKDMIVERNLEEKARDAADFIFLLRKRRADFLSVDADHNLNGEGLKIAFDEINRIEQEYLSLFIGKSFTENSTHYFEYIPNQSEGETSIIFRMSQSKGVVPSTDLSGTPIILKTLPDAIPESYGLLLKSINQEKDKPRTDLVYYRIPISATVSISDGKNEFFNRRISVYQYGPIVRMPLGFMIKDSGLIEFTGNK